MSSIIKTYIKTDAEERLENEVIDMEKTTILLNAKKRATKRPSIEVLSDLYSNHTTKQIAEIYQVPEGTVKSWIYRYRQDQAREVRA